MNKPRLFKREYAHELINLAKSDLETAIMLRDNNLKRKDSKYTKHRKYNK